MIRFSAPVVAMMLMVPQVALGQETAATCSTLVTIQNRDCTVRRVFVCDDAPADWRNVAIYGPDGARNVITLNTDGATLNISAGQGQAATRLGDQADPFSVKTALQTGQDTFDYQMLQDPEGMARISGTTTSNGDVVTIDGRILQVLQSRQTLEAAGEVPSLLVVDFLYDTELGLLIGDLATNGDTGAVVQHRTPVSFHWPGDPGFDDYTPRHGCEG